MNTTQTPRRNLANRKALNWTKKAPAKELSKRPFQRVMPGINVEVQKSCSGSPLSLEETLPLQCQMAIFGGDEDS